VAILATHIVIESKNSIMKSIQNFTAIIQREDEAYVALCPEFNIVSQGSRAV
jgi:hypothetical protein